MNTDTRSGILLKAIAAIKRRDFERFKVLYSEGTAGLISADDVPDGIAILCEEADARVRLYQVESKTHDLAMTLLSYSEPAKAVAVLDNRAVGLLESDLLNTLRTRIMKAGEHCQSWEAYRERYTSPVYFGEMDISKATFRGPIAIETARRLAPKTILSIGPNDCRLERSILEVSPGASLYVAEISDGVTTPIAGLIDDGYFVTRTPMSGFYDWAPPGSKFDLVVAYEILEHVPNALFALNALREHCAADGAVLISVPNGPWYFDPAVAGQQWLEHVRAFDPASLKDMAGVFFQTVRVDVGSDKTIVATCSNPKNPYESQR